MIGLLAIGAHLFVDVAFGLAALNLRTSRRGWLETVFPATLVGIYLETLSTAALLAFGIPLGTACYGTLGAMIILAALAMLQHRPPRPRIAITKPVWYEWAVLLSVCEKIVFSVWQLTRTHTYFDDALTHWSGRARALFGGVNWSMDPASPFFFGQNIGNNSYPLLVVIWRASTAKLAGEWNEIISRADGVLFFIVIVATMWLAVWRFSRNRGLAAAAAFTVSAVPLHAWHAAAGYADVAVEAFMIAGVAALLRDEWLLAGVLAAGAVWSKDDGLVLYFPALLIASVLLRRSGENGNPEWRNVLRFVLGFLSISPWLAFNYSHALGITAGQGQIAWHPDAPGLLLTAVLDNPTSGPLWIAIFVGAIYFSRVMLKDRTGRALLLAFVTAFGAIVFTFTSSSAYEFLVNQMTIHRVMMQFSSLAILVMAYGFWLTTRSVEKPELAKKTSRKRGVAAAV